MKKVAVALSGGVDSSVTALLLKQRGYEVVGITGMMTDTPASRLVCENAKNVADKLEIPHYVLNLSESFKKKVIDYFDESYLKSETPNPCAMCNKCIKWGEIFDYAINELDCDYFATGHYANIQKIGEYYTMFPAKDPRKDQLYFLSSLTQEQFARTLFPLYEFEKSQIRELAEKYDLPSKSAKDSQDICFIPKPKTLRDYLYEKIGHKRGDFIDVTTGKKLGEHDGCYQFTIGQRKGIGIAAANPLYVVRIDAETNTVFIGEKDKAYDNKLTLKNVRKTYPFEGNSFDVKTKIRYNMPFVDAHVQIEEDRFATMTFPEPVYSVTPGQAAVWYDKNDGHLLGVGWIIG